MSLTLADEQPRLVFFHSSVSGHCRRVEGFLAQVLQRRRNHGTFKVLHVAEEERPDLLERIEIGSLQNLVEVVGNTMCGRIERPTGCHDIEWSFVPLLDYPIWSL